MTTVHPTEAAFRAASRHASSNLAEMPAGGLMVAPFPEPGPMIRTAMEQLQQAMIAPPADEEALHNLAQMPRPWDPSTCSGQLRSELWVWLDLVAMWVNEQHLWNVTRVGIPECWPAHPQLIHDLAVLASGRYFTSFAVTPAALEDWHRYSLPGFLERLRDRLGDGCRPGKHQPRPRAERDASHSSAAAHRSRQQRYRDDLDRSAERVENPSPGAEPEPDELHERW